MEYTNKIPVYQNPVNPCNQPPQFRALLINAHEVFETKENRSVVTDNNSLAMFADSQANKHRD